MEYSSWNSFLTENINKYADKDISCPNTDVTNVKQENLQNNEIKSQFSQVSCSFGYGNNKEEQLACLERRRSEDQYDSDSTLSDTDSSSSDSSSEEEAEVKNKENEFSVHRMFGNGPDNLNGTVNLRTSFNAFAQNWAKEVAQSQTVPMINTGLLCVHKTDENNNIYTIIGNYAEFNGDYDLVDGNLNKSSYSIKAHEMLPKIVSLCCVSTAVNHVDLSNVVSIDKLELINTPEARMLLAKQITELNHLSLIKCKLLQHIKLPLLETASSIYLVHLSDLETLDLSNLKYLKSFVVNKTALNNLTIPKCINLKTMRVSSNSFIESVNASMLKMASTVVICDNDKLTNIKLTNLQYCKTFIIKNNPLLKSIDISNLEQAHKFVIEKCPKLQIVDNNKLKCVDKILYIDDCPELSSFKFSNIWAKHLMAFGLNKLPSIDCSKPYFGTKKYLEMNNSVCSN